MIGKKYGDEFALYVLEFHRNNRGSWRREGGGFLRDGSKKFSFLVASLHRPHDPQLARTFGISQPARRDRGVTYEWILSKAYLISYSTR